MVTKHKHPNTQTPKYPNTQTHKKNVKNCKKKILEIPKNGEKNR